MSTQANPTALSPRFAFARTVRRFAERAFSWLHRRLRRAGRLLVFAAPNIMGCCMIRDLHGARSRRSRPEGVGVRSASTGLTANRPFSVFSKIVDALIPVFGLALSAHLLTATALLLWLAAMAALAGQLASGRLKWAILICVAASSGAYGGLAAPIRRGLRDAAAVRRGRRAGGARGAARGTHSTRRCSFCSWPRCFIRSWRWRALGAVLCLFMCSKIAAGFILA